MDSPRAISRDYMRMAEARDFEPDELRETVRHFGHEMRRMPDGNLEAIQEHLIQRVLFLNVLRSVVQIEKERRCERE